MKPQLCFFLKKPPLVIGCVVSQLWESTVTTNGLVAKTTNNWFSQETKILENENNHLRGLVQK